MNAPEVTPAVWGYMVRWLTTLGEAPALLLSNTDEAILHKVTTNLCLAAMCERGREACQQCHACRLTLKYTHPDVIWPPDTHARWTIKSVRELLAKISLTSLGSLRVVVLPGIETASLPAANALLKSLEEPAPSTRYILTTRNPRRLLPTIHSRCWHVRLLSPLPAVAVTHEETINWEIPLDENLPHIERMLRSRLYREGPSPALRHAYQRLRDYYTITARRGNKKLAGEVLLLSLP